MKSAFSKKQFYIAPLFSLFTSTGTLFCCALPALFVSLGAGATLATLLTRFPQLIWLSEYKKTLFTVAAAGLFIGGIAQWRARTLPCPMDSELAKACASARKWSKALYFISVTIFLIGFSFAYIAPLFFERGLS